MSAAYARRTRRHTADARAGLDGRAAARYHKRGRYALEKRLRRGTCRLRPKKKEKNTMPTCENTRPCPCTYPCPRHGKCCECVAHHRDREGGVPGCFFTKEGEATYDRSVAALWRDYSNRK